ncbi:thiamine thiazole synthase, chloroplastic-like protein [Tanacetum coccineum]
MITFLLLTSDNTLNKCPTNLNLKNFKLDINYSSLVNSEFKSRANSWIRYAIHRNVEDVDLCLFDVGVGQGITFEDELFFNTSCITRMTLSFCRFNRPNGVISLERLECLCLFFVTLDEDMIGKILSGSPCLESLELNDCHGYRRIDVTSKSVKKLVEFVIFAEEVFRGILESLGHVKRITFGDHCSELLSLLKAGSDMSNDDRAENGGREEYIDSSD